MKTDRTPFITGSHAYGDPRPDSDIDLVININDSELKDFLIDCSEEENNSVCRFGNLNLVICDDEQYDTWKHVTEQLKLEADSSGVGIPKAKAKPRFLKALKDKGLLNTYERISLEDNEYGDLRLTDEICSFKQHRKELQ